MKHSAHEWKELHHIKISKGMSVNQLVNQMKQSGVMGAGRIAKAADILEMMLKDKDCTLFFGLAGAMVPGGMKEIIIDMLKNDYIDVFVTTGATLTHDLVEALGYHHLQGTHKADDAELYKKGIVRMYDSYMPAKVYEKMEDFTKEIFKNLKSGIGIKELLWEIGRNVKKESILSVCAQKKIPIYCPALSDSGLGLQLWNFNQSQKLVVDAFSDLNEMIDIAWTAKKTGVFYIGGGVPKNHIQQAMQFSKQASYGIQITTDRPEFGGSSGAELREGISWGKMEEKGQIVDVFCDATIAVPLIYAAVKERL